MRRAVATIALAVLAATAAPAAAQLPIGGNEQLPGAYGDNDSGGFRNVLPPGENGRDNAIEFGQFQTSGQRPPHFDDQLAKYVDLL
ncbi:MAG: hypothetical protein QOG63_2576, partial [Thermoleophilaceae bacterium]|nr:hypothetical protein [Thermoleophilaceae bacterium]